MLEIEIDGKKAQVPDGSTVMDAAQQVGYIFRILLPQETFDRRQLPHVSCAGGKGAEAVAGLRNAGDQRHEGLYPLRTGRQGAEGVMEFLLINHPGLPDLRSGR
jgi:NADH-quinone oxidoreductase subunit G